MKKIFREFRDFITRGNVIDLAIGIIIGSAFSTAVNSVVDNLLMPPLGLLLGNVNFQDLFIVLRQGEQPLLKRSTLEMAHEVGAVTLNYGQFLTDFISFLILGFGVFLIIKAINTLQKQVTKNEEDDKTVPTEKDCPFCFNAIPIAASRCPFCTSHLDTVKGVHE